MSSETMQHQLPGRRRRPHKRSRHGCVTCKQRHIRCDEQKPVCTNCLVRGGDCGYVEQPRTASRSTSVSASASASASGSRPRDNHAGQQLARMSPSGPGMVFGDPFDSLPIDMPHKSQGLFYHFAHYRVLTRSLVAKSPDSYCVGISLSDPGLFRASLLLAATHINWTSGSLQGYEETFLYHKLEAMRLVNEQILDPVLRESDACIYQIGALAFVESAIGDTAAAEAHLRGLFTILNIDHPEQWQHRLGGLLQRIILLTGSFIAASRGLIKEEVELRTAAEYNAASRERPHYVTPPGPAFSTIPYIATRLSPFYIGLSPDIEACKADAEGEVLIMALQRLSLMSTREQGVIDSETGSEVPELGYFRHSSRRSSRGSNKTLSSEETNDLLLADTDAYIASLLFKPLPVSRDLSAQTMTAHSPSTHHVSRSNSPPDINASSSTNGYSKATLPPAHYPYANHPAELFPSSSRAWASAAYLYVHTMLGPWRSGQAMLTSDGLEQERRASNSRYLDPYLLQWLLDTLRADINNTEEAMRIGAYSSELWLWKVVVCAYVLFAVVPDIIAGRHSEEEGETVAMVVQRIMQRRRDKHQGKMRWRAGRAAGESGAESQWTDYIDSDEVGDDDDDECDGAIQEARERALGDESVAWLRVWIEERLRSWSRASRLTGWEQAREALRRTAWLENWDGDAPLESLWRRVVVGASATATSMADFDSHLQ